MFINIDTRMILSRPMMVTRFQSSMFAGAISLGIEVIISA